MPNQKEITIKICRRTAYLMLCNWALLIEVLRDRELIARRYQMS